MQDKEKKNTEQTRKGREGKEEKKRETIMYTLYENKTQKSAIR